MKFKPGYLLGAAIVGGALYFPITASAANTADYTLTRSDIEKVQATNILELLRLLPGMQVTSDGGWGSNVRLSLRGSEELHVQVKVNGQRVANAIDGIATVDFLDPGQIQRIELYTTPGVNNIGSGALAGTLNIVTLKAAKTSQAQVQAQVGQHRTQSYSGQYQASRGATSYLLNGRILDRIGSDFSKDSSNTNGDKDAFRDSSYLLNIQHQLSEKQSIELSANHNQGRIEEDLSGSNPKRHFRNRALSIKWQGQFSEIWSNQISLGTSKDWQRELPIDHVFSSARHNLQWDSQLTPFDGLEFDFGASWQKVQASDNSFLGRFQPKQRIAQTSYLHQKIGDEQQLFVWGVGHHNTSGTSAKVTKLISYRQSLGQWNFGASYHTAFNPPTLLHMGGANFASTSVEPESANIKQFFAQTEVSGWLLKGTLFKNHYESITEGKLSVTGLETSFAGSIFDIQLKGSLTLQEPKHAVSDNRLTNRAAYFSFLSADYQFKQFALGSNLFAEGSRISQDQDGKKLGDFAVINLHGKYDYSNQLTFGIKITNLFDAEYSTYTDTQGGYFTNEPRGIYLSSTYQLEL